MRWIPDSTGRFEQRPYYTSNELDKRAEREVVAFLMERYGHVRYPLSTEDLGILLERHVDDLDLYYDFPPEQADCEGVTLFNVGKGPSVRISSRLPEGGRTENRRRSTITHEMGHTLLHGCLVDRLAVSSTNKQLTHLCRQASAPL